jgi:hypothetical protein
VWASSHDLESDYPWSGLNDKDYPIHKLVYNQSRDNLKKTGENDIG